MSNPLYVKKGYIEVQPGKQIHYRYILPAEGSSPKIPIVYLHKSASSSVSHEKLMLHYAALGHAGYAPDMPGFGGSFDQHDDDVAAISEKNTRWYVDTFINVFQQLGLYEANSPAKQVALIGHHSGACLGVEMAAVYPEFIQSITLVGPTVIGEEDRAEMKKAFFAPFNEPVEDGSHLLKTWNYLRKMGVGPDLALFQREAVDHIRAWRGRNLVYGAVWAQDSEGLFKTVKCPVLTLCARDDVLWAHIDNVQKIKPEAKVAEVKGANFSLDLDAEGIIREWDIFQKEVA